MSTNPYGELHLVADAVERDDHGLRRFEVRVLSAPGGSAGQTVVQTVAEPLAEELTSLS